MSKKIRELKARKATLVQQAADINAAASAAGRDLTDAEAQQFDDLKAQISGVNKQIENEEFLAEQQAALGAEVGGEGRFISVEENSDPRRGFNSFGEFCASVRTAGIRGAATDGRLAAALPGNYANESSGADGGYLIPPEFSAEIWRMSMEDGSLIPMTANTEISGNSMAFPKDETTPWSPDGVQAYWRAEGAPASASKPKFDLDMLRLHELMVLVPVTNELLADAGALGSYLPQLAADRIMWRANEAILFGTGAGQPMGCLNSNALITVAKESGQTAGTITQPNISKMRSRLKAGELKNAVWLGNPDIIPALEAMTVGQIPIFLPPNTGMREAYDGTLNGRPFIATEHANGLGAAGDLSLVSLKGYRTITKAGGIESATSMHLYFDSNAMAFRFIFRMDGQPILKQPIQPPAGKGSNTRSYFVQLGARA